ncbi:MAG: endolytic transglycosylase MltG [Polyangiaceae bacterium]|nr:endolytic transglycosylase MltG [Polyangiaceae bacterium]
MLVQWQTGSGHAGAPTELAKHGLVQNRWLMALYLRLFCGSAHFEPGPHLLQDMISPHDLVARLARLRTRPAVRVTVPEGWNSQQIASRLEQAGVCPASSFLQATSSASLLGELRITGPSAEGYLFPATYALRVDSNAEQIVRTLVAQAHARLNTLVQRHADAAERLEAELGWSTQQIVTLASIIEKETAHPDERRLMAGVFFNRLRDPVFRPARMLQSDPTAAYGCIVAPQSAPSCHGYTGRITAAMLRDRANAYNTYLHPGLPPGPIANPGESALEAVLDPAQTDALFFVAQGARGQHRFSRTLEQHNEAVRASRRSEATSNPSAPGPR